MISTRILATLVFAFGTLAAGGFFLIGNASADTAGNRTSLIERIATRFNLNRDDVRNIFNEEREAHQKEMAARLETRLSEAVANKTITEEQKALILKKHEDVQKEREASLESRRAMTPEERRADAQKHRDEMKAWATANNIPDGFLGIGEGMRKGGHGAGRFGK